MKILFICKKGNIYGQQTYGGYGQITGLLNSARFVADDLSSKYETKVVKVVDDNAVDKELFEFQPDIVVLEAVWMNPAKLKELSCLQRYRNVRWLVRVHSKPAFLANEGMALEWLIKYAAIPRVTISGNNLEFVNMFATIGISSVLLPNIYNIDFTTAKQDRTKGYIDVGCFGAIRPMKNHLQQAAAAIHFAGANGKHLKFHINATRSEQGGDNVLKNLRALFTQTSHELIEHPWFPHSQFLNLVAQMDVGLQVSLSESFNIVSADFVSQNIPIVTSKEVEFVLSAYHADTGDILSISKALSFAYNTRIFYGHTVNQWLLSFSNNKARKAWAKYLEL